MGAIEMQLAAQITLQLLQGVQEWQAKVASGTLTAADVDAKLLEVGASRADLVAAIAEAKAAG